MVPDWRNRSSQSVRRPYSFPWLSFVGTRSLDDGRSWRPLERPGPTILGVPSRARPPGPTCLAARCARVTRTGHRPRWRDAGSGSRMARGGRSASSRTGTRSSTSTRRGLAQPMICVTDGPGTVSTRSSCCHLTTVVPLAASMTSRHSWRCRYCRTAPGLTPPPDTPTPRSSSTTAREAGASLTHPHAQIVAINAEPRHVDEELEHIGTGGGCVLCRELLRHDHDPSLVVAGDEAVMWCPWWSSTPYELLVATRRHGQRFEDAASDLPAVAATLRQGLARLDHHLDDPPYNLFIHSLPAQRAADYHWHIHIRPRLQLEAGFELGTGIGVNTTDPARAAEQLRRPARTSDWS